MKKMFTDPEIIKKIFISIFSGFFIVIFYFFFHEFNAVLQAVNNFISVIMPFILGLGLAYLLSFPADYLENLLPEKWTQRLKEIVASICVVVLFIIFILLFFLILIPQLVSSGKQLSLVFENFASVGNNYFDSFFKNINLGGQYSKTINYFLSQTVHSLLIYLQKQIPSLIGATLNGFKFIGSSIIGIIVALYILLDKKQLLKQSRKIGLAFLNQRHYIYLSGLIRLSATKFGNFINGKLLDSFIIGIICFLAMVVLDLEYPILISFVVGVTNIIPFFGPFIGAVPGIFILLIVNPWQALWFALLILAIQQLDGNVIGPYILGDSVGLSSLWIMFAIIVGGAYFGVGGMILGVPVMAVIYFLIRDIINKRLCDKGLIDKDLD